MENTKLILEQIADCFYQGRNDAGIELLMGAVAEIGAASQGEDIVNQLFDAIEQEDYILAADLLHHEIAAKL